MIELFAVRLKRTSEVVETRAREADYSVTLSRAISPDTVRLVASSIYMPFCRVRYPHCTTDSNENAKGTTHGRSFFVYYFIYIISNRNPCPHRYNYTFSCPRIFS